MKQRKAKKVINSHDLGLKVQPTIFHGQEINVFLTGLRRTYVPKKIFFVGTGKVDNFELANT